MIIYLLICVITLTGTGCDSYQPASPTAPQKPAFKPKPPVKKVALQPPTDNHALFEAGAENSFYTPTGPERPWSSGAYGCVRNSGNRMHEGVDIRCLQRNSKGEPLDEVRAAALGQVVFANRVAGASSYGQYVVLTHEIERLVVYTLYAHMSVIRDEIEPGLKVKAGHTLGIMGRTANHNIPQERAHLHFEIGFVGSLDFDVWMRRHYKDPSFNKFGIWHGFNLLGMNPVPILISQHTQGEAFSLSEHLANQPELLIIRIQGEHLPLAQRQPGLLIPNKEDNLPVAGHEIDLNINGTPLRIQPLTKWTGGKSRYELVSVNDEMALKNRCRKLIFKMGAKWVLTDIGHRLADLLATGVGKESGSMEP